MLHATSDDRAQESVGQSAGTLHSKLIADLTEYPQLLGIGLGKVAGRWGGPGGRGAASPGASNEGQLLQVCGQALAHDGHQLRVDFFFVHAQVLQPPYPDASSENGNTGYEW